MDSLDQHAGAIQAVGSLVLVLVTVVYVVLTWRTVVAVRRAQGPYVYIDVVPFGGSGHMQLEIGNAGSRAAEHVEIAVLPETDSEVGQTLSTFVPFQKPLPYLAPGRRYAYMLALPSDMWTAGRPRLIALNLNYRGAGDKYSGSFVLDLAALDGVLLAPFKEPATEVADALKELKRGIKVKVDRDQTFRLQRCVACSTPLLSGARKCPACREWQRPSRGRLGHASRSIR